MSTEDATRLALYTATAPIVPVAVVETKSAISTPQTARLERRRLRFYEPQVRI